MRVSTPTLSERWPVAAAKFLFDRERRLPRDSDGIVTAFRDGQVTLRSNRRTEGFTNALQEHGYQGVRRGDLVIHSMDGFAGAIGVSDSDGKVSPVVHCYTPARNVDPRFYAYLLRGLAEGEFITSLAKGIRERSTAFDSESFRSLLLPVPPFGEQQMIADFLDTETTRIDALITKKRRLIELLEERRRGLITGAVLGGIGYRDPSHSTGGHRVKGVPLKRLARVIAGQSPPSAEVDDYTGEGLPFLQGNAEFGDRSPMPKYRCDTAGKCSSAGDLLVSVRAPVGALNWSDRDYGIGRGLAAVRPGPGLDSGFCWWWLHTAIPDLRAEATGSTYEAVTAEEVGALQVPETTMGAQRVIAGYLDTETARIYQIRSKTKAQVALLQEFRQTLITAAVTGELEVPGVAA